MEEPGQLKRTLIDASAGAISGGISRTVTSPLDVIKIRFQDQLEPTTQWALLRRDAFSQSKYTGMLQATKDIFREEGLPGFWRVNVPALLMVMPYTAIQFTVLHKLKSFVSASSNSELLCTCDDKFLCNVDPLAMRFFYVFDDALALLSCVLYAEDHINISPYLLYVSGALAGCAATVGSYPFDLIRTLLASQGEPKVYPNMRAAFSDILKKRGFRGLYAGLTPTLIEIVPYAGLQFGTYDNFKPDDTLSSFQLFLCGLAAGTCTKAVCHPLDVVKKRFQVEGLQRDPRYGARVEHRAYRNMYDALCQILHKEGWAGLYKGITPSIVKAAPAGTVTFVAYEFTSDWLESLLT
ncbi:hypothetical protein SASPL_112400 [Salvia splendens]|uniref:Solute carrier family 25 (Mitochondrial thiamine pyrophosphate transporter), member 19 n=1 Tax=Salvia splendens TaxID=180675 RepID=A0A8X8Y8P7_SALSN|nr:hypothetical protein SASPL_112400 [Salvia splendens]